MVWREILPAAPLRNPALCRSDLILFLNYFFLLQNLRKKTISGSSLKNCCYIFTCLCADSAYSYTRSFSWHFLITCFNAKNVFGSIKPIPTSSSLDFLRPLAALYEQHHTPPLRLPVDGLTVRFPMLGLNKFFPTWLLFKLFALLAFLLTLLLLRQFLKQEKDKHKLWSLVLLALNPLLLIEVVANGHNDYWMLLPALAALYLSKFKAHNLGNFSYSILLVYPSLLSLPSLTLLPFLLFVVRPSLNPLIDQK